MSDAALAAAGRVLAEALINFAYSRKDEDKKRVAAAETELCQAYRAEVDEDEPSPTTDPSSR
jgi:hypothetical protein